MRRLLVLSFVLMLSACARFDDSAIWEELLNHKERIEKLEAECDRLNSNISALQVILEAIQSKDYVTDIVKVVEDGVEIGYSLTFAKGGKVTIYHGTAGEDGSTPKIGIQKASDGLYYWTSDGEWLTDEEGEKIPAAYSDGGDGKYVTPLFRVAEGVWYVSYDSGNSWRQIVQSEEEEEAPLFKAVTYDKEYVYLTLADGTVLTIPIDASLYTDVPQINNSYIRPKAKDEPIKILCFGSSWFLNTWWYLNKITGNLGINAEIHGYYVGHSCFDEWIALYNNDLSPFAGSESTRGSYRYISVNGENYTSSKRVSGGTFGDQEFRDAWYEDLLSEDWDIIAFQQGAHQAPKWKYWESGPELVSIIRRHCGPNTMIAFNSTWTPSVTSSSLPNDTDGLCSKTLEGQKLWQTMNFDNCKRFMNITGVNNVSPNGAMMYTLRRDPKMNIDGDDLCYDGLHPNHGLPMFALASVFYETFIAPFYGISIKECTWLPTASDKKGPFNNSVFRPVTEAQRDRIYEYVRLSLSNRFGFNEPYPYVEEDSGWTKVEGVEVKNTMPQESGYSTSRSGIVTEYSGYDWSKYDVRVTCRYGGNELMYAGCFWGENDTYLGGFWKSTGTAKVFNQVVLTEEDLPEGVSWSDVVKIGLSSQEDESFGFRYTTLEVRPKDPSISVLAIGNSFSVDAMEYLWDIVKQAGYEEVILGNLYIGGCSLETHSKNFKNNSASYTYYTNTDGSWKSTTSSRPINALEDHDWDYITMQQASAKSGQPSSYGPYLSQLIEIVRQYCPDSKLAWHMTWAYEEGSKHSAFPNYGNDQMTMYNAILSAVESEILSNEEFKAIIPTGTAIQNLRTSFIGDNLTRDDHHLSYDKGRFLAALTYAKAITGCDLSQITYTPPAYTFTANTVAAMKEAVDNACAHPYEITQSTYLPEDEIDYATASLTDILKWEGYDPADYTQMDVAMTKYAFYNSTDAEYISTMLTQENSNRNNILQFVATPIYDKEDLPYGTLIVQRSGQQHRPEGWTALDVVTPSAQRPGQQTSTIVEVTEEWWGSWNYRAFNLSKVNLPNLTDKTAEEVMNGFGIFVPIA